MTTKKITNESFQCYAYLDELPESDEDVYIDYDFVITIFNGKPIASSIKFELIFDCKKDNDITTDNMYLFYEYNGDFVKKHIREQYLPLFINYLIKNNLCVKIKNSKTSFKLTKHALMLMHNPIEKIQLIIKYESIQSLFSKDELIKWM